MELTPLFPREDRTEAKLKNSFALVVLLIGLFVGSLFVDVGQLITGAGFSGSAIREHNVLETAGKTWVAYTEPAIKVSVVTDANCFECTPDEALLWMRRILPTLDAKQVAYDSFEGKELIVKHGIVSLPAFVFETGIEKTDFFAEAGPLFIEQSGQYFFDMNKIGLPVGKYLQAPAYENGDIRLGNESGQLTVTLFSDFACEYCKEYHTTFREVAMAYGDRVNFVFKHFPLPMHPEASTAALAASCADAQGYFLPYADLLFDLQSDWTKRTNATQTLKNYAWRIKGLQGREFAQCMDEKRFQGTVEANQKLAEDYNLQAAPVTFIGTEFLSGAAPKAELEALINTALGETK